MVNQISFQDETNIQGISRISIKGYKSIGDEQSIEIRPLTILAGANSSGKSSIMQPLLLMKQTLEAPFETALLLDGPILKYTSVDQLLSIDSKGKRATSFEVGLGYVDDSNIRLNFQALPDYRGFQVSQMVITNGEEKRTLRPGMSHDEINLFIPSQHLLENFDIFDTLKGQQYQSYKLAVSSDRCFLKIDLIPIDNKLLLVIRPTPYISEIFIKAAKNLILKTIHLTGIRGKPNREYPATTIGSVFPGNFENYTASIIATWQENGQQARLEELNQNLQKLGLTSQVRARRLNDAQIELQVGRFPKRGKGNVEHLFNLADVGFGVSQVLPALVALLVAQPGQLVYLEQPELHLHARAQNALAEVLADAARRGVKVVVETHSDLLLLGIQALVAEGNLPAELVKLHWFELEKGFTKVRSADLDKAGAFADWPEDFADVSLQAQQRYLDAAESRLVQNLNGR